MDSRICILNVIGMEYPQGYIINNHVHEDYAQLYYICRGEVSYLYDSRIVSLRPGDFLLVPPKVVHGMLPTPCERLVVLDIKFKIEDHEFGSELLKFGIVTQRCPETVQSFFQTMFSTAQSKNQFYPDILSNLLATIFYLYLNERSAKNERETVEMEHYARLGECTKKVLSYIEGGVMTCDFSSLDAIAADLDYNKEYMSRTFSQEMGMSITKYLQTLRMDKARELLLDTDYDINQISRLVNYRDVTHFIRLFKRHFGITPEKFRRTAARENALRYSFRTNELGGDG